MSSLEDRVRALEDRLSATIAWKDATIGDAIRAILGETVICRCWLDGEERWDEFQLLGYDLSSKMDDGTPTPWIGGDACYGGLIQVKLQ